ncbi:MAG TPA: hypothetical protein VHS53_01080, partial [Mucilaginibacter sp.]|nr:hypothetical protein [Mucilaginibacter sp.]
MISKRTIRLFFACFAAWSYVLAASAQTGENQYRAVHWTIYDGISQGENYFMLKDVSGFLWIGSRIGLNRF